MLSDRPVSPEKSSAVNVLKVFQEILVRDPKNLKHGEPDINLIKDGTNTVIAELVVESAHAVRRPFLRPIAPRTIPFLLAPWIPMLSVSDRRYLIAASSHDLKHSRLGPQNHLYKISLGGWRYGIPNFQQAKLVQLFCFHY